MNVDSRTQYTKKVIRKCFFEELKTTPLNKITVKSICDNAGINRSTFYRYYNDAYDLMAQIENELLLSFQSYAKDCQKKSLSEAIEIAIHAIKNNEELYPILLSENADHLYINRMIAKSYDVFKQGFQKRYPNLSSKQQKWLYYFIAQGCTGILIDWINEGMEDNPKEIAHFIAQIDNSILNLSFN